MNKTDVITEISRDTGISTDVCEKVIKAFEEKFGDALMSSRFPKIQIASNVPPYHINQ